MRSDATTRHAREFAIGLAGRWRMALRLGVGPLALLAFVRPWIEGTGALAGTAFSGYDLVGFAGRLQVLDLGTVPSAVLRATQYVTLAVAIAAIWQMLLAPRWRSHPAYVISGWFLVALSVVMAAASVYLGGRHLPSGLVLLLVAGAAFATAEWWPATQRSRAGAARTEPVSQVRELEA